MAAASAPGGVSEDLHLWGTSITDPSAFDALLAHGSLDLAFMCDMLVGEGCARFGSNPRRVLAVWTGLLRCVERAATGLPAGYVATSALAAQLLELALHRGGGGSGGTAAPPQGIASAWRAYLGYLVACYGSIDRYAAAHKLSADDRVLLATAPDPLYLTATGPEGSQADFAREALAWAALSSSSAAGAVDRLAAVRAAAMTAALGREAAAEVMAVSGAGATAGSASDVDGRASLCPLTPAHLTALRHLDDVVTRLQAAADAAAAAATTVACVSGGRVPAVLPWTLVAGDAPTALPPAAEFAAASTHAQLRCSLLGTTRIARTTLAFACLQDKRVAQGAQARARAAALPPPPPPPPAASDGAGVVAASGGKGSGSGGKKGKKGGKGSKGAKDATSSYKLVPVTEVATAAAPAAAAMASTTAAAPAPPPPAPPPPPSLLAPPQLLSLPVFTAAADEEVVALARLLVAAVSAATSGAAASTPGCTGLPVDESFAHVIARALLAVAAARNDSSDGSDGTSNPLISCLLSLVKQWSAAASSWAAECAASPLLQHAATAPDANGWRFVTVAPSLMAAHNARMQLSASMPAADVGLRAYAARHAAAIARTAAVASWLLQRLSAAVGRAGSLAAIDGDTSKHIVPLFDPRETLAPILVSGGDFSGALNTLLASSMHLPTVDLSVAAAHVRSVYMATLTAPAQPTGRAPGTGAAGGGSITLGAPRSPLAQSPRRDDVVADAMALAEAALPHARARTNDAGAAAPAPLVLCAAYAAVFRQMTALLTSSPLVASPSAAGTALRGAATRWAIDAILAPLLAAVDDVRASPSSTEGPADASALAAFRAFDGYLHLCTGIADEWAAWERDSSVSGCASAAVGEASSWTFAFPPDPSLALASSDGRGSYEVARTCADDMRRRDGRSVVALVAAAHKQEVLFVLTECATSAAASAKAIGKKMLLSAVDGAGSGGPGASGGKKLVAFGPTAVRGAAPTGIAPPPVSLAQHHRTVTTTAADAAAGTSPDGPRPLEVVPSRYASVQLPLPAAGAPNVEQTLAAAAVRAALASPAAPVGASVLDVDADDGGMLVAHLCRHALAAASSSAGAASGGSSTKGKGSKASAGKKAAAGSAAAGSDVCRLCAADPYCTVTLRIPTAASPDAGAAASCSPVPHLSALSFPDPLPPALPDPPLPLEADDRDASARHTSSDTGELALAAATQTAVVATHEGAGVASLALALAAAKLPLKGVIAC